ncbi:MAG: hypothetical protein ABIC91_03265 [Nanoarchaeota archaeon]|nr:hypothetical protein [Nanoarchaeota archaeon]MBU1030057.1 hypothetical protein [Nanoarchaeota archaeon]MBU1850458.1 hypothetical protein [Nanoarchaeota archaeon]
MTLGESSTSKFQSKKFGTASGVMVPSILAILGAVMYLIVPKVLGGVGLIKMLGIILLAHSITIATAFSISAIATNINVKGGGLYYLISRSLGRAFGGSMGIQLFLAQTIAAAFYTIAFTKVFHELLTTVNIFIPERYLAMLCLVVFFLIVFRGAQFVIKIQYLILITILLSLVSIFLTPNINAINANLLGNHGISIPFWIAFALFFPAVTGIDAGVGMSGDLKTPRKSLVKGTFFSIILTMCIYVCLVIKLSYSILPIALSSDPLIIKNFALIPSLIYAGIMVATVSSALSCMMTAPRSLRAITEDEVIPKKCAILSKSIGKSTEPHYSLIVSFIIGEIVLFFGGLDIVSIIVSMFFLNVYGWINGAAFLENISKNPSYRPTFNAPWIISLYGMVTCYFVMYLFNPYIMLAGIAFQLLVFYVLTKNRTSIQIESVWEGVWFQIFRTVLNRIESTYKSKKNWRPTIVSFSLQEQNRNLMLSLIDSISSNRSIMKIYMLIKGNVSKKTLMKTEIEETTKEHIKENDLDIFPRVIITQDCKSTVETIIQSETIGNMSLNTVLLDYDEKIPLQDIANISFNLRKNFLILRNRAGISNFHKIDVWWKSPRNGNLALLIAYLVTHSNKWKENNPIIRIFHVVSNKKHYTLARERMNRMIAQSRIDNIEVHVIISKEYEFEKVIHENSAYSDLVIIGLSKHKKESVNKKSIERMKNFTSNLNASLIVNAHDEIDFKVN